MWLLWIICIHCICCTAMDDIRFWNKPVPPQNKQQQQKKVCLSVVPFIFTNNWKGALWVLSSEQKPFFSLQTCKTTSNCFPGWNFSSNPLNPSLPLLDGLLFFFFLGHSWSSEVGSCQLWWFSTMIVGPAFKNYTIQWWNWSVLKIKVTVLYSHLTLLYLHSGTFQKKYCSRLDTWYFQTSSMKLSLWAI